MRYPAVCVLALSLTVSRAFPADPPAPAAEPPREWIDPDTGHRVIRLSDEPGTASLYFHQNAYSPDGKKLVVTTPHGISTVTLATRAIEEVVSGKVNVIVVGRKSGDVYYSRRQEDSLWIFATNLETKATRQIGKVPRGGVSSLNADETLLLGSYAAVDEPRGPRAPDQGTPAAAHSSSLAGQGAGAGANPTFQADYNQKRADGRPTTFAESKELSLHDTLARIRSQPPRTLFTMSTATGEVKTIHQESEWINHLQ